MDCVRGFAGQGQYATLVHHSAAPSRTRRPFRPPKRQVHRLARLLPRNFRSRIWVNDVMVQRIHQRGGLADLARILERVLGVRERGLGIAKQPQSQRPIGQDCHPDVLAKSRRQRTMLGRIVKRERLIVDALGLARCLP